MTSFEENTHVFIIQIWLEPREIESAPLAWRGVIEHVPSDQQRYFTRLSDLTAFIRSFLEDLGVNSDRIEG